MNNNFVKLNLQGVKNSKKTQTVYITISLSVSYNINTQMYNLIHIVLITGISLSNIMSYHNGHLGGTNIVTDEIGAQVKYVEYKPFGDTKTESGSLTLNKKFTGKELDDSTGLYDYNARMYDAKLGRFISADTLIPDLKNPQSLNRYSYCYNNPLKYIDPTGNETMLVAMLAMYINAVISSPDLSSDLQQLAVDAQTGDFFGMAIDAVSAAVPGLSATMANAGRKAIAGAANVITRSKVLKTAEEFVHIAPKVAKDSIKEEGLKVGHDGYLYVTKEKYLKDVSLQNVAKKIFKKDLQEMGQQKLKKGAIKVTIKDINPDYYNTATKNGVPQWRLKGDVPLEKITNIKDY